MKRISKILMVAAIALGASACMKYEFDVDYTAPITISFEGVGDNNIATLEKGVVNYDAKIIIKSDKGLVQVQINEADNRTGAPGAVKGTFDYYEAEKSVEIPYSFSSLTDNACIRVTASDMEANSVSKNLVVSLTPVVEISESGIIAETGEVYYGIYYASWLGGRVYMRSTDNIESYKSNIDVTFGEFEGTPYIMSPDVRKSAYGLPNLDGLHATKIGLTTLTVTDYNAINKVDASPIQAIADPTDDKAEITAGKVYVFKRDDGKKGLLYISASAANTNKIQNVEGEWVVNTPYHKLTLSSKVIAQ